MMPYVRPSRSRRSTVPVRTVTVLACLLAWTAASASTAVYRWVDDEGVTHLSSTRPPAGVQYESVAIGTIRSSPAASSRGTTSSAKGNVRLAAASPEQVARRSAVIAELQNRECVVALEGMDRMARSGQAVEPTEFRRLQQTADLNCSQDPITRRQQEEQAAKLRVSRGDTCVNARNTLAEMLAPGRRPTREQLKTQQEFIESHCKAPVR
jgi:hypothetical protein